MGAEVVRGWEKWGKESTIRILYEKKISLQLTNKTKGASQKSGLRAGYGAVCPKSNTWEVETSGSL